MQGFRSSGGQHVGVQELWGSQCRGSGALGGTMQGFRISGGTMHWFMSSRGTIQGFRSTIRTSKRRSIGNDFLTRSLEKGWGMSS